MLNVEATDDFWLDVERFFGEERGPNGEPSIDDFASLQWPRLRGEVGIRAAALGLKTGDSFRHVSNDTLFGIVAIAGQIDKSGTVWLDTFAIDFDGLDRP